MRQRGESVVVVRLARATVAAAYRPIPLDARRPQPKAHSGRSMRRSRHILIQSPVVSADPHISVASEVPALSIGTGLSHSSEHRLPRNRRCTHQRRLQAVDFTLEMAVTSGSRKPPAHPLPDGRVIKRFSAHTHASMPLAMAGTSARDSHSLTSSPEKSQLCRVHVTAYNRHRPRVTTSKPLICLPEAVGSQ